jgi:hypothetical protein
MTATVEYNQFSRNGAPPPGGTNQSRPTVRWWLEEEDDLANAVASQLEFMKQRQIPRITQAIINTRLYGNQAISGRAGVTFSHVAQQQPWLKERITWNCVQASADTLVAKMVKNKPKPWYVTNGGDWKMQRRAKKMNKFVDGVFYENKAHQMGLRALLDSCIWGDGVVKVMEGDKKRVKWERILSHELWTDDMDSIYGDPRSLHHSTNIDRQVLLEKAKAWLKGQDATEREKVLEKVEKADRAQPDGQQDILADRVAITESWHLPSGPDAEDGKHCITIKGCTIWEEEWEHDCYPFAKLPWAPRSMGYWSQSLAEQLQNIQLEINLILQTIKQSFWKGGTFRVFLPSGSRLVKENLTNQIASVVTYSGDKPPVIVTPQLVQPEIFEHLNLLWNKAFEQAGISQMQATSQKPAGLNSGEAIRSYNDIQTDRFTTVGQRYEQFFLDLANLSVMVVKDIAGNGSYKVKAKVGNKLEEIDWKDIQLDEDDYVIMCFPISSLPQDPSGRQQTITEWVQAGWINARPGKRLMDFPDLEMAENLANAAEDFLTAMLEKMCEEDDFNYIPEPFDDLNLSMELGLEYYQRGKYQGLDPKNLDKLRQFIGQVQDLTGAIEAQQAAQAQQQAMQQQAMKQAGKPMAKPQQQPTSDIMQIGAQNGQQPQQQQAQ